MSNASFLKMYYLRITVPLSMMFLYIATLAAIKGLFD
jgi:hypothetical protein